MSGQVQDSIREGENKAELLALSGVFHYIVGQMHDVEKWQELADEYDAAVLFAVRSLMRLLVRLVILATLMAIALIALALFLPLFTTH